MIAADQTRYESARADISDETSRVRLETHRIAGVNTAVRVGGQPHAEAVVFVHGFLSSSADFAELLEDVSQFAYVVAPDMPNFGRSQRSSDFTNTVQGYAAHLEAVLAQLGIQRAHLVLHDFGGPWGMQWAVDHPAAVASVSLFNIGVMRGYRWHTYARAWQTPLLGELMMAAMPGRLFGMMLQREQPRAFPAAFLERMFAELDAGTKRAALALYRATPDWGALSVELGNKLAPLQLPALVIWGEADRNLPVTFAAKQAEYFAVQGVHTLASCGHWPFVDDPARCSSLLCAFLQRYVGVAATKSSV